MLSWKLGIPFHGTMNQKREKYVLIKGRIQQTLNVYKSDLSEN